MSMTLKEKVARRMDLAEKIERLEQEKALIDDELRQELSVGHNPVGDWDVQLRANRRLDANRVAQRFPVAQYPHLYEPKVSTSALKEYIAPIELEAFYVSGQPAVVVK